MSRWYKFTSNGTSRNLGANVLGLVLYYSLAHIEKNASTENLKTYTVNFYNFSSVSDAVRFYLTWKRNFAKPLRTAM